MKNFTVAFLICISSLSAVAQTEMQDRMNLQKLLEERARNFSEYTTSIQKRSGIFGNKTKGDLAKSNEVLIDIVRLDNDIMDALKRTLSYKTFEKTTDNYSSRECEMKLEKSMQVTDTLMRQLSVLENKMKQRNSSTSLYKGFFYLLLFTCIGLAIKIVRDRRVS